MEIFRYTQSTRMGPRHGALIRIQDRCGHTGWGDIAPLPGFSRETLDEAIESLTGSPTPSAHFALECAQERLSASQRGIPLRYLWNPHAADRIAVNALYHPDSTTWRQHATVKVKVGRRPMDEEIAWLKAHFSKGEHRLRLDANRAWTKDQAWRFAEQCVGLPIDYIEEPWEGAALQEQSFPLPLAADETIYLDPSSIRALSPAVVAVVLKPTLIGGWSRIRELTAGRTAVISSCFESSIGLSSLAEMAAALHPGVAAGLDPWSWIHGPCPIAQGQIDLWKL